MTDITTWRIKSESKHLNQLLKNPSVEELLKQSIANGESIIKTSTKIYLKEKLIISANADTDNAPLKIPSKDKTSIPEVIPGSKRDISVTKEISLPNIFFPKLQKNELTRLVEFMKKLQIGNAEFIAIPVKNARMKNLPGDSIWVPSKLASSNLPA